MEDSLKDLKPLSIKKLQEKITISLDCITFTGNLFSGLTSKDNIVLAPVSNDFNIFYEFPLEGILSHEQTNESTDVGPVYRLQIKKGTQYLILQYSVVSEKKQVSFYAEKIFRGEKQGQVAMSCNCSCSCNCFCSCNCNCSCSCNCNCHSTSVDVSTYNNSYNSNSNLSNSIQDNQSRNSSFNARSQTTNSTNDMNMTSASWR